MTSRTKLLGICGWILWRLQLLQLGCFSSPIYSSEGLKNSNKFSICNSSVIDLIVIVFMVHSLIFWIISLWLMISAFFCVVRHQFLQFNHSSCIQAVRCLISDSPVFYGIYLFLFAFISQLHYVIIHLAQNLYIAYNYNLYHRVAK